MINISKTKNEIKRRKFSSRFEKEILKLLTKKKFELENLITKFNSKRNPKYFFYLRRRFPLFNDHLTKLKKFEDYPNLNICIIITWLIEKKLKDYYRILYRKIFDLDDYLRGENKEGKKTYEFLYNKGKRGISEKILIKDLKDSINNMSIELSDYKNEAKAYSERDIKKIGLITNDAVKCLKDFEGRTFPFLRTICLQIKPKMNVLEVGVGTGILSIASVIAGAKKVVGVELNPITCLLADIIIKDLEKNRVIPKKSIEILWGDALKFGAKEFKDFKGKQFDALISENIYTGMFFELQMKMAEQVLKNNLIKCKKRLAEGFYTLSTDCPVIPEGMSSGMELVEVSKKKFKVCAEVVAELKKKGIKVERLTKDHIYDQIHFDSCDPSGIVTLVKSKILKKGFVNAVNFYSTIRMMEGDYIDRNENKFLNGDSLLILNKPLPVKKGDKLIIGLAYNEADSINNIILEVRKMNKDGSINGKYDARLNISKRQHKKNIRNYIKKNRCRQPINLSQMGDFEVVRSCSFENGYEKIWLSTTDYINLEGYGV